MYEIPCIRQLERENEREVASVVIAKKLTPKIQYYNVDFWVGIITLINTFLTL